MNNEIYASVLVPAREAPDGETPTRIVVTEENNGYAVFRDDYDDTVLLEWFKYSREQAIEYAVARVFRHREQKPKVAA